MPIVDDSHTHTKFLNVFGSAISAAASGTDWALVSNFFTTCMASFEFDSSFEMYEYENRVTNKNDYMDINYLILK